MQPGGCRNDLGSGERQNAWHRQMMQEPIALAACRHLNVALRHEHLHQRRHRLRLAGGFAQQAVAAVAENRAGLDRGAKSAEPQSSRIERQRHRQLLVADRLARGPAGCRSAGQQIGARRQSEAADGGRSIVPGPATRIALPSSRRPRQKRADWIVNSPTPLKRCGK